MADSLVLRGLAGLSALIGGTLMVFSGFNTHGLFLSILSSINDKILPDLPFVIHLVIGAVLTLLNILITLGGITVILGGILIISRRTHFGSLLIAFGGGAGFLSLLLAISYYLVTVGVSTIILHAEYWLGVLFAAISRWLTRRMR